MSVSFVDSLRLVGNSGSCRFGHLRYLYLLSQQSSERYVPATSHSSPTLATRLMSSACFFSPPSLFLPFLLSDWTHRDVGSFRSLYSNGTQSSTRRARYQRRLSSRRSR